MIKSEKLYRIFFITLFSTFFINSNFCSSSLLDEKKAKPKVVWSGTLSNSGQVSANTAFLNDSLPDKTNWVRTVFNLNMNSSFGEKRFGHKAAEVDISLRHKEYWGLNASKTDKEIVRVGNSLLAEHSHGILQPAFWIYSAWVDLSFDAISKEKSEGLNRIKVGYFPFSLGRGIALGDSYGVSQDFLGTYVKSNDYFMPALMFYGKIPSEKFSYQIYIARPEANSASVKQTLAITREHFIDSKGLPFGGTFKDDHIFATQLTFKVEGENKEKNFAHFKPYGFFLWARDKKVNIDPDSDIDLFTGGLAAEFKNDNFEFGFDAAFNAGKQVVRAVDLNKLTLEVDSITALHKENFDKILQNPGAANEENAIATADLLTELSSDQHRDGNIFVINGVNYKSKEDRISKGYTNTHKGFMFVTDASYSNEKTGAKLAIIAGHASGDKNPHEEKVDKDYKGFLGVNETYSSKRVPSMIILGGAKVKRPLALKNTTPGSDAKLKDFSSGAFTDLNFFGGGISFSLDDFSKLPGSFSTNVLAFFKDKASNKVEIIDAGLTTEKGVVSQDRASNSLGVELNAALKIKVLDNTEFSISAAGFLPGQHYKDIQGATLDDSLTKRLEKLDRDKATLAKKEYKIGNDNCWFISAELKITF